MCEIDRWGRLASEPRNDLWSPDADERFVARLAGEQAQALLGRNEWRRAALCTVLAGFFGFVISSLVEVQFAAGATSRWPSSPSGNSPSILLDGH